MLLLLLSAFVTNAQNILSGIYRTGENNTKIEIKENGGVYSGIVIASDKAERGILILKDITPIGGEWKGQLFSAKKKKWYKAVLKREEDQLLITVNAGIAKRTVRWSRE